MLVCRKRIQNDPSSIQVVVGKHKLKRRETTQSTHKVAKIYMHAKYLRLTGDYDIALLKLMTAINFTREVSPVCLPKKDVWDKICVTTGWGLTQGEWPVLDILRLLGCFVSFSRWPDTSISSWNAQLDCSHYFFWESVVNYPSREEDIIYYRYA